MFAACLSPNVSPAVDHGGGPAGPHSHAVEFVTGASVIGELCNKVALWVLEASAGNHNADADFNRRSQLARLSPTVNLPRICCNDISMSPVGTLSTAS